MSDKWQEGLTLMEMVVVLIVMGAMLSLAIPRFFGLVEKSRSIEAFNTISVIRNGLNRCYALGGGTYADCILTQFLDNDPNDNPGAHFTYALDGLSTSGYTVIATRNTLDGGNLGDTIALTLDADGITRSGTGAFKGIK